MQASNHNTYHLTYRLAYVMFKIKWRMIKVVAKQRRSHQT